MSRRCRTRLMIQWVSRLWILEAISGSATRVAWADAVVLPFRGILHGYPGTGDAVLWDRAHWTSRFARLAAEGFSDVVWYGPNELTNGEHVLVGHVHFPEARERPPDELERIIAQFRWLFQQAHAHGLRNTLVTEYYDLKVRAAIEALVYARTGQPEGRMAAEALADSALAGYVRAAQLMAEKVDPYYEQLTGARLSEGGKTVPELLAAEKAERRRLPALFSWPGSRP
ncbi:MAG: hypothetical protein AB1505_22635 [Candidatus Latescibacterota bacterium]